MFTFELTQLMVTTLETCSAMSLGDQHLVDGFFISPRHGATFVEFGGLAENNALVKKLTSESSRLPRYNAFVFHSDIYIHLNIICIARFYTQ